MLRLFVVMWVWVVLGVRLDILCMNVLIVVLSLVGWLTALFP